MYHFFQLELDWLSYHSIEKTSNKINMHSGGFRKGQGGLDAPPSGIRPPADPKGSPFDTFSEIHFWPIDPKIFLKAPLRGSARQKKTRFFCQNFQKVPKNSFFFTVFSKICVRRRKFLPK